ncbi:hypothetical protein BC343_21680 [Mucilaginibacter pedocola]|uniref:TonB-dependent receptor plug domain-containing protein n=2 Tax=Mucilaginibacter pedocola TaxID=1792845 RepID=A0A1S9PJD2_9SPHI|nr:hypothetical protein BC343_21680 [Mucilaginibacter pedocola]
MTNAEVIAYLASHKNTCGRIPALKLAAINHQLEIDNRKRFTWKGLIAAASLSMLFPVINAKAKPAHKTEQAPVVPAKANIINRVADSVTYITIKGVIRAKEDGQPLPGASIKVKYRGKYIEGITNVNGLFSLRVPAKAKRVLVSFVGYQSQDITLKPGEEEKAMEIMLQMNSYMLGGFGMH